MTPMLDAMMIPGVATTVLAVGPALLGVAVALLVGVAWLASGAAEELRRTAAREWDARHDETQPPDDRLAA